MNVKDIEFCIIRAPGTNCDTETSYSLEFFGCNASVIHVNKFFRGDIDIKSFHGLVIPGGFSYGDHIRSGAILGKLLKNNLGESLLDFVDEGKLILGICNGFQVLVEMGILPGIKGFTQDPTIALGKNISNKFEDRWVYLRNDNEGRCIFSKGIKLVRVPVNHGEGKVILPFGREEDTLKKLIKKDQVVFRYANPDGSSANGNYPFNPNSSFSDIAGICDPSGQILGMMPHPEKAFHRITYPDWTRTGLDGMGDGYWIFKNMIDYLKNKF
jgi:phosphoribosylformylglycinamidine synthase|tara:strand:- start:1706 stop:2515 length:810 start_codon:yes stop_codon:yes gene_type:complete